MSLVWQSDLPTTEKVVMLALADAANDDGNCWPPISGEKGLCRKTSLSERAVQKAIKSLCDKQVLDRIETPGKGVFYTLTPAPRAPPHEVRPAPQTLTPAPRAPKPSITIITSEAKASSGNGASAPAVKPEHVIEAWNAMADRSGVHKARMTPDRRKKLSAFIRQHEVNDITEAIWAVPASPFLCGQNDRGWKADLDFFMRPARFAKLLEGSYG